MGTFNGRSGSDHNSHNSGNSKSGNGGNDVLLGTSNELMELLAVLPIAVMVALQPRYGKWLER